MKKVLLIFSVIFIITACSPYQQPKSTDKSMQEGQIANRFIEGELDLQAEGLDPLEEHDQPQRDTGLSDDQEMIYTLLRNEQGVEPESIVIVGRDVWVEATIATQTIQEKERRLQEIKQLLASTMLRYDIHVRVR